jgi:pimeloyl-ACP methyl ester carboxylesterase
MATFVLVHGAWHGAWCWKRVAKLLRAKGHDVYVPTLTGVGERTHLAGPDVSLDTHIMDVVNEIKWQELSNVVLVGHSYGGMVVSGVAEKMEKQIASLVMLDAFVSDSGQSLVDMQPPAAAEMFNALAAKGEWRVPARPAAMFHVNEKDQAWVDAMCVPHPIKCFTQKLTLTGARDRIAKKSYIRASQPSEPFDFSKAKTRDAGWKIYDVPCGHDVMVDMPDRLTEILLEVA